MVIRSFEIESYSVTVSDSRAPSIDQSRRRVIDLTGRVLAHGIQTRATLYFLTFTPSSDYIGGVFTSDYYRYTLLGWLPIGEYDEFYDVLRSEKPVYCRYSTQTDDPFNPLTAPAGSGVRSIALNTGAEPVGEGLGEEEQAINDLIDNFTRRFDAPSLLAGRTPLR